jgi:hypothetical protein
MSDSHALHSPGNSACISSQDFPSQAPTPLSRNSVRETRGAPCGPLIISAPFLERMRSDEYAADIFV